MTEHTDNGTEPTQQFPTEQLPAEQQVSAVAQPLPAAEQPAPPAAQAPQAPQTAGSTPKSFFQRGWVIATCGALAGALLLGGGIALGTTLSQGGASQSGAFNNPSQPELNRNGESGIPSPAPGGTLPNTNSPLPLTDDDVPPSMLVASDATSLVAAIEVAVAATGGLGASSIETLPQGWLVEIVTNTKQEVDVLVTPEGQTSTLRTSRTATNDPVLDLTQIAAIIDAALAAVPGALVNEINTSDDRSHAFEVKLYDANYQEVDLELAADLSVVSTDRG